jgi:hypothetical protein
MNEQRFTPGPWRYEIKDGVRYIRAPEHESRPHYGALFCDETYYPWCSSNEADWPLVAAAPTMADYIRKRADAGDTEAADIWRAICGNT